MRLLDLPPTLLAATGAPTPREMQGSPLALGGHAGAAPRVATAVAAARPAFLGAQLVLGALPSLRTW